MGTRGWQILPAMGPAHSAIAMMYVKVKQRDALDAAVPIHAHGVGRADGNIVEQAKAV